MTTRLFTNALISVASTVYAALILFILYWILLRTVGIERVGIWSVVMAIASSARLSELGLSRSVARFVAQRLAQQDPSGAIGVVQTGVISVSLAAASLASVIYFPARWLLPHLIPPESLELGIKLLPFALLSLWGSATAAAVYYGLDGCQRTDLRGVILMASNTLYLAAALLWIPQYGLFGLVYAQLAQVIVAALTSWLVLRTQLVQLPWLPFQWRRVYFVPMLRYGMHLQIMSIAALLLEPVAKGLLSRFGGLAMVGTFELANRMTIQLRVLLASAAQALVPFVAHLQENTPRKISVVYEETYSSLILLGFSLFGLLMSCIPLISILWFGYFDPLFAAFSMLMSLAWLIETLSLPAAFVNQGTGHMRWNTIAIVVTTSSSAVFGAAGGSQFGGAAVVLAYAVALAVGASTLLYSFHRIYDVSVVPHTSKQIILAGVVGVLVAWLNFFFAPIVVHEIVVALWAILVFTLIVALPFWRHPSRRRLSKQLRPFSGARSE